MPCKTVWSDLTMETIYYHDWQTAGMQDGRVVQACSCGSVRKQAVPA